MSDADVDYEDEPYTPSHKRRSDDLDHEDQQLPGTDSKKTKKKKSKSSSSKSSSSSSASLPANSSASKTPWLTAILATISSRFARLSPATPASSSSSSASASFTSPKSLMSRVIILAVFSLALMGSFVYYQQLQDEAEMQRLMAISDAAKRAKSAVDDEVIEQRMGKAVAKVSPQKEREFGCKEVSCIAECNGKAKPKCLKSKACVAERYHICHKRCRKTRCEERCKNEPKMGYVEKEQGLENCKEACTGPTAQHNKCIVKCHVKFKPCSTKCKETANKFKCDNPKILALLDASKAPPADDGGGGKSSSKDDDDEDGGGGDEEDDRGGGGEEEEEEDAPPAAAKSKGKQPPPPGKSSALPGLDDDDLL